jgi:hypothetical protein
VRGLPQLGGPYIVAPIAATPPPPSPPPLSTLPPSSPPPSLGPSSSPPQAHRCPSHRRWPPHRRAAWHAAAVAAQPAVLRRRPGGAPAVEPSVHAAASVAAAAAAAAALPVAATAAGAAFAHVSEFAAADPAAARAAAAIPVLPAVAAVLATAAQSSAAVATALQSRSACVRVASAVCSPPLLGCLSVYNVHIMVRASAVKALRPVGHSARTPPREHLTRALVRFAERLHAQDPRFREPIFVVRGKFMFATRVRWTSTADRSRARRADHANSRRFCTPRATADARHDGGACSPRRRTSYTCMPRPAS